MYWGHNNYPYMTMLIPNMLLRRTASRYDLLSNMAGQLNVSSPQEENVVYIDLFLFHLVPNSNLRRYVMSTYVCYVIENLLYLHQRGMH